MSLPFRFLRGFENVHHRRCSPSRQRLFAVSVRNKGVMTSVSLSDDSAFLAVALRGTKNCGRGETERDTRGVVYLLDAGVDLPECRLLGIRKSACGDPAGEWVVEGGESSRYEEYLPASSVSVFAGLMSTSRSLLVGVKALAMNAMPDAFGDW